MRRIKNGEPVFHTHECSEERKGKVMTAEELHDFAVQILMEEYSDTNADVVKYDKKTPNEADFYFVNSGKKPNFTIGATGEKKVNVMVVYRDEFNTDISGIDTSWMVEEYRVSLFAQELHTPQPVSPKRLDALWDALASR